jgi:hypothetical protein
MPSDSGKDLLRYLKQAAALDPAPSPLAERIAEVEAGLESVKSRRCDLAEAQSNSVGAGEPPKIWSWMERAMQNGMRENSRPEDSNLAGQVDTGFGRVACSYSLRAALSCGSDG